MCMNSIGVACDDVERLCIIDVAVKQNRNLPHKKASCKPERRGGLPHIMSDAREAKIATSHYDSSTVHRTSVTVTFHDFPGLLNFTNCDRTLRI